MPQTPSNQDGKAHALLIGVDDYRSYDSTGNADLKGSRNDVLLLAWYCLTVLRMPIENIRMLTSPQFEDDELKELVEAVPQEVSLDLAKLKKASEGAREYDVTSGVDWLLENTKEGDAALLAFSGHGSWSKKTGPVLCLGDTKLDGTTGEVVDGVLPLRQLQGRIGSAGARSRLIAMLDCCHITGPATHRRHRTTGIRHKGTVEEVAGDDQDFNVSDRVLLAAQPGKLAHQMRLGTRYHGALTFALVTAAERWLATNGASHGSYKQVWTRAKEMVKALEVPQRPMMKVPAARWTETREEPFLAVKAGDTVKKPDAVGMSTQLPPDWLFTIYLGSSADPHMLLAQIVTMGWDNSATFSQEGSLCPPVTWGGSSEQWFIGHNMVRSLSTTNSLFITSQRLTNDGKGNLLVPLSKGTTFDFGGSNLWFRKDTFGVSTYRAPENTDIAWSKTLQDQWPTSYHFSASTTNNPMMSVEFAVSAQDPTILVGAQWYQAYSSDPRPAPTGINPGSSDGIAYQNTGAAPVPTPTNLVYSAVSKLTQQ